MKTMIFPMALIALTAFSPKPAFAAPDTGPQVDNIYIENFSKAGVSEIDYQIMDNGKMIITRITFTNGRQVVPEQSDHPVAMSNEAVKKYLEMMTSMTVNSTGLAVDDHQRRQPQSGNVMIDHTLDLDLSNCTDLAAMTATAPGILERHSVPAVTSYQSGSSMRL